MLTLQRIRETQARNERESKLRRENYKSPSGFTILARFMKEKNLEIINKFCDTENKSQIQREILIEKYHKLNYYTPTVSYQLKNEENQFSSDDEDESFVSDEASFLQSKSLSISTSDCNTLSSSAQGNGDDGRSSSGDSDSKI